MDKTKITDFRERCYGEAPITASARRDVNGCWDINYSSILTRLIQEAGRWCRRYASDLFIDWRGIAQKLENGSMTTSSYLFGFREDGVDAATFVLARYKRSRETAADTYRAIWRLDVTVDPDDSRIALKLYETDR